jgi:N-acetylmuramoyl-L-alanine amidase
MEPTTILALFTLKNNCATMLLTMFQFNISFLLRAFWLLPCLIMCLYQLVCYAGEGRFSQYQSLKDVVICIDPGHQAKPNYAQEAIAPHVKIYKDKTAPGTKGVATFLPEYKLTLEVALQLQKALENYHARVVMTRINNEVKISNVARAQLCNRSNAALVIHLHADAANDPAKQGMEVFYPNAKYVQDLNLIKKSQRAAQLIGESLGKTTQADVTYNGLRDDLIALNWSTQPVVLLEMGFMTNAQEDALLSSTAYQEKIVQAIVSGVVRFVAQN